MAHIPDVLELLRRGGSMTATFVKGVESHPVASKSTAQGKTVYRSFNSTPFSPTLHYPHYSKSQNTSIHPSLTSHSALQSQTKAKEQTNNPHPSLDISNRPDKAASIQQKGIGTTPGYNNIHTPKTKPRHIISPLDLVSFQTTESTKREILPNYPILDRIPPSKAKEQ